MSDNLRRFRAVRKSLTQLHPNPSARITRHLTTLAALISGIVGAKRVSLPEVAAKVPDATKPVSRERRFRRFVANDNISYSIYFTPFVTPLLSTLADIRPLTIIFDGSTVGRGCVALVASVCYKGRALPIAWLVREGKKGHFPEAMHLELLGEVQAMIPPQAEVVFLGDGEFDGTELFEQIQSAGWHFVCRTAHNRILSEEGERFRFSDLDVGSEPYVLLPGITYSAKDYGPLQAVLWHEAPYKDPVYLITNMDLAGEAIWYYRKRFRIETMFSDHKSRGFHLHKSHLSDPARLSRMMIAVSLAYIWMVSLGSRAIKTGTHREIHRSDRCDLSLFQLGFRMLEHILNEGFTIPVCFAVLPYDDPFPKTVR